MKKKNVRKKIDQKKKEKKSQLGTTTKCPPDGGQIMMESMLMTIRTETRDKACDKKVQKSVKK